MTTDKLKILLQEVVDQTIKKSQAGEVHDEGAFSSLFDTARFAQLQRIAKVFAESNVVPDHYRGKIADCIIACDLAIRAGIHPLAFMQASYVVHGRPGIEAKLAIGLANMSGVFGSRIGYRLTGEGMKRECVAFAADKCSGEIVEGPPVSLEMAKAEGWLGKNGSKWQSMPEIMLRYRAAMFLIRLHCPEVLMGLTSTEELADTTTDFLSSAELPAAGRHSLSGPKQQTLSAAPAPQEAKPHSLASSGWAMGTHRGPAPTGQEDKAPAPSAPTEPGPPAPSSVTSGGAGPGYLDLVKEQLGQAQSEAEVDKVLLWMDQSREDGKVSPEEHTQAVPLLAKRRAEIKHRPKGSMF